MDFNHGYLGGIFCNPDIKNNYYFLKLWVLIVCASMYVYLCSIQEVEIKWFLCTRTCARATEVLHQLSVYLEGGEHANKMVESLRKVTS